MATPLFDDLPVNRGAVTGAIAFVVGSVLVFPLLLVAGPPLSDLALSVPVAMTTFSYVSFHAWPVLLGGPPALLLFSTLPGVILASSAYTIVAASSDSPRGGPARGATIVVGYFALSVVAVGFFLFRRQTLATPGTVTADIPGVVVAIVVLFTGIVFPVIFGGLGGALAERRGH